MPTVNKDETREHFMARCIPILREEKKEQQQPVAICSSIYERKDK